MTAVRLAALAALLASLAAPPPVAAQATGTEYVTFWRGDLRVFATEPLTRVEILDLDTGGPALAPSVLVDEGDSLELFSGPTRHVRIVSSDASGLGELKPIVVWTGRLEAGLVHPPFTPSTINPWMSYLPAIQDDSPRNGTEVGRVFIGFASREAWFFARRGADPTSIVVEDMVTNKDFDSDDSTTLDALSPALIFQDATYEVYRLASFEDDTIKVSANVDVSVMVGSGANAAQDWTVTPPSHAAGDEGIELGTDFITYVKRSLAIFPTQDATTVLIDDLSDGDDTGMVLLANGAVGNPQYDIYTPVLSAASGGVVVGRPFGPIVSLIDNEPNPFDDDLVRIRADKPVLVLVGPVGSDVNEFADVAFSVPTGPASRLVYTFAQNGGAEDLQVFVFDAATQVSITSLTRTSGFGAAIHHDVLIPPFSGGNAITNDWYYHSPAWNGELLRIESDAPMTVISGDYDAPNFGAFIPFVLQTPQLPPVAVAAGPVRLCPGEPWPLDGSASFDQDALVGGFAESWTWDCDLAVDSDGNTVPDDDADAVGPMVDCGPVGDGMQVARLTFTDDEGQSDTDDHEVDATDSEAPTFTLCPADLALDCADPLPADEAEAADDCSEASIVLQEVLTPGPCPQSYTLTRTWTATDASGNADDCVQVMAVVDDTPPSVSPPGDLVLECPADTSTAATGVATGLDNCGPVTVDHVDSIAPGCGGGFAITRTWTVTDACGLSSTAEQSILVDDTTPPELELPADAILECPADTSVASNGSALGSDACGLVVTESSDLVIPGCGTSLTIERTWTTTDECGLSTSGVQTIEVRDTTPPELALPADALLECPADSSVAANGSASGSDACGDVTMNSSDVLVPGCGNSLTIERTWTATDECGLSTSGVQTIELRDTTPPQLVLPADALLECPADTSVAANGSATGSDSCGDVVISSTDAVTPGCGNTLTIERTWTATDECGLSTSGVQTLVVQDTTPPSLAVPAPLVLECSSPGGVPMSDPAVQAFLAAASASDDCGPPTVSHDVGPGTVFPSGCLPGATTVVTFTAEDDCGNSVSLSSSITVQDTTAPTVTGGSEVLACLWPPNHRLVCFSQEDFNPVIEDLCGSEPLSWRFLDCASDQPDDGLGDGHTERDCVVAPDGSGFCVRAERTGLEPGGRHYAVVVAATDACGNESEPVLLGSIHVPHDQSPAERDCLDPTKVGLKRNEPLPF